MKRFYSLLLAFVAIIAAQAQNRTTYALDPLTGNVAPLCIAPDAAQQAFSANRKPAPQMKATEYENFTLEDGQYILGNSTDDEYAEYGSAPYTGDVLVGAVIYSSSYKELKNVKALGIRFCVPQAVNVKCVTLHDSEIEPIVEQTPHDKIVAGWNYVAFNKPQKLDPAGTFISYTYEQTNGNYGICNWPIQASGGFWVYLYNSDTGKWSWGDFSPFYGAVCIQLIIEAEVPDYQIAALEGSSDPAAVGTESQGVVYVKSDSRKDISSLDYSVTIDGKTIERHQPLTSPIPSGLNQIVGLSFNYDVPETVGTYDVSFAINKVNDEVLETPAAITFKQDVLTRIAKRHTVVEEFTGTGCGWCPRGWVGMEYLKRTYPDDFIGIAVHKYNDSDPMYCARYCNPGFGGAPTCVMDRKTGSIDPYRGTGDGIDRDLEAYNRIAPTVDVKVTGTFTEDRKKVTCSADVEFLANTGKYTIAYVLTADELTAKNWMQTNYYANESSAGALPQMPELAEFAAGGTKGKGQVNLTFNDVLIGSSYSTTGSNLARALGASKHTAGEQLNNAYTCSITVADPTQKVLDYDNVYVVALVIDTDGHIANAARAKVETLDGINSVLAPVETPADAYDLSGRRITAPAKGISIVGGRKVMK